MAKKQYYDSPFSLAIKTDWEVFEKMVAVNIARGELSKIMKQYNAVVADEVPPELAKKVSAAQLLVKNAEDVFDAIPAARRELWEARVLESMDKWCLKMTHKWKIYKGGISTNEDVLQEAKIGCLQAIRRISSLEMPRVYKYVERYCFGYAAKLIARNEKTTGDEVSGDQPLGNEDGGKTVFSLVEGENTIDRDINNSETETLLLALKSHIENDLTAEERFIVGTLFNIDVGNQSITFEKGEKRNIYSIGKNIGLSKYMAKTVYESAITKLRMAMLEFCSEDDLERIMSAV